MTYLIILDKENIEFLKVLEFKYIVLILLSFLDLLEIITLVTDIHHHSYTQKKVKRWLDQT